MLDNLMQAIVALAVPIITGVIIMLARRAQTYLDAKLEEADRKKLDEAVANGTALATRSVQDLGLSLTTQEGRAAVLAHVSDYLDAHIPGVAARLSRGDGLPQNVVQARIDRVQTDKPTLVATLNTAPVEVRP